jgi:hypothetical protein
MVNLIAIGKGLVKGVKTTIEHPIQSFKQGLITTKLSTIPSALRNDKQLAQSIAFGGMPVGGAVSGVKSLGGKALGGIKNIYTQLSAQKFRGGIKPALKASGLIGLSALSAVQGFVGARKKMMGGTPTEVLKATFIPSAENIATAGTVAMNLPWAIAGGIAGGAEKSGMDISTYMKNKAGIVDDTMSKVIDDGARLINQGKSDLNNYTLPAGFLESIEKNASDKIPSFEGWAPNISISAPPSNISLGAPVIGMPSISVGGGGMDMGMLALLMGGALGGGYLMGRRKRKKKKRYKKKGKH